MLGCAGNPGPLAPSALSTSDSIPHASQTHLWGYYDVYVDIPSQTATAILNRQAMFTANVVNFLNGKAAGLSFHINGTPVTSTYIDIDIDISITHPFPGMSQYNGYDVRGVFMGDGSKSLSYNPKLKYAVLGTDQYMLPDPTDSFGGPDGYTRWFNLPEFSGGGMPLFQYTQGKMALPGFAGTATLNPYKYFADNLLTTQDLWSFLNANSAQHGVFSAGATNTRNYYLRFPNGKGIKYGYAVIASWKGVTPADHPANAPEAMALSVTDSSDVYYIDPTTKGGNIKLDVGVWDWDSQLSAGKMEDYKLIVESTVLNSPATFSSMTPTGGGSFYSTYHVEIPADNVQSSGGNEYWVILEHKGFDYTNPYGIPNSANTDPLAAFFRYDLKVSSTQSTKPVCDIKVVTPVPYTGWAKLFTFDASALTIRAAVR